MTQVALIPVILAAVATILLALVWYHPRVFGGVWMRLSGITPEIAERTRRKMWLMVTIAFLASMLVAYVMDYFGIAWSVTDWGGALQLGFWCWAGFAAPSMLGMVLWEGKPVRAYLIVALYWLVSFILIAFVLLYTSLLLVPASYNTPDGGTYIETE